MLIFITFHFEAVAQHRDAAQRRAVEAEEAMIAGEFVASARIGEGGMEQQGVGTAPPTCVQQSKADGQVNNLKASVAEMKKKLQQDVHETKEKANAYYGKEHMNGEVAVKMKNDLDTKLAGALEFLTGLSDGPIARLGKRLTEAVAVADIKAVSEDVGGIRKRLKKEQVKALSDTLGQTKRFLTQSSRKSKRGARGDNDEDTLEELVEDTIPICSVLKAVVAQIEGNKDKYISQSAFVAKGGEKASAFRVEQGQEPMQDLAKNAVVRKRVKDVTEHMKNTGSRHSHMQADENSPDGKKVLKILRKGFASELRTRMTLPDENWGHNVFSPDVAIATEGYISISPTLFCTTEARVYLSGEEILCGSPYNNIQGNTMSEKRNYIESLTVDGLIKMLEESKGWLTKTVEGECIMIPSGHLVINYVLSKPVMVRGSVGGDDLDKNRVRAMLSALLECYPELNAPNQGLAQFHEWLIHIGF